MIVCPHRHDGCIEPRFQPADTAQFLPGGAEFFAVNVPGERLRIGKHQGPAGVCVVFEAVEHFGIFVGDPGNEDRLIVIEVALAADNLAVADKVKPIAQARAQRRVGIEVAIVVARQTAPLVRDRRDRREQNRAVGGLRQARQVHIANNFSQFDHGVPFEGFGKHGIGRLQLEEFSSHQPHAGTAVAEHLTVSLAEVFGIAHGAVALGHVDHHPNRLIRKVYIQLGRGSGPHPFGQRVGRAAHCLTAVNVHPLGPGLHVARSGATAVRRSNNFHVGIDLLGRPVTVDKRLGQLIPGPARVGDAVKGISVGVGRRHPVFAKAILFAHLPVDRLNLWVPLVPGDRTVG